MKSITMYTNSQTFWLVALRVAIGWHFLYEGVAKILTPGWSAYYYLMDSQGYFADFFYDMAGNSTCLAVINYLNLIGLTLVGLSLICGLLSKWGAIGGIAFLAMFYLSHPPFIGAEYMAPFEGSYLWIDKNFVEMLALLVLIYFPTSHIIGLDRFVCHFTKK